MVQSTTSSGKGPWRSFPIFSIGAGAAAAIGNPNVSTAPPYMTSPQMAASTSTSGGNYVDERLLDARLKESEARLELRFADRLSKIADQISALAGTVDKIDNKYDTLATKLDHKAATSTVWAAAASAVVTGLLAVVAIVTWGNDKEQTGIALASTPAAQEQIKAANVTENTTAPALLPRPTNNTASAAVNASRVHP